MDSKTKLINQNLRRHLSYNKNDQGGGITTNGAEIDLHQFLGRLFGVEPSSSHLDDIITNAIHMPVSYGILLAYLRTHYGRANIDIQCFAIIFSSFDNINQLIVFLAHTIVNTDGFREITENKTPAYLFQASYHSRGLLNTEGRDMYQKIGFEYLLAPHKLAEMTTKTLLDVIKYYKDNLTDEQQNSFTDVWQFIYPEEVRGSNWLHTSFKKNIARRVRTYHNLCLVFGAYPQMNLGYGPLRAIPEEINAVY